MWTSDDSAAADCFHRLFSGAGALLTPLLCLSHRHVHAFTASSTYVFERPRHRYTV